MSVPTQGFRHAATLLLTNSVRAIPAGASPEAVEAALARLARELVALAGDMRQPAGAVDWLVAELSATIDRLPHVFDRTGATSAGAATLAGIHTFAPEADSRDLFLIYVPEDRLPIAAPLAIELTKRRVSVAFASYEVTSALECAAAVAHGLAAHRCGVVLWTNAFERGHSGGVPAETGRLRVLRHPEVPSTADDLTRWVHRLRPRNVAE